MPTVPNNLAAGPLADNLAALWTVDPALARLVDAVADDAVPTLETTRTGDVTAASPDADGRRVYLHSRYDPRGEVDKQIAAFDPDALQVHLLGLGLGYAAEAALDHCPAATVWAFEARPAHIVAAFATVDLSDAILGRRLRILHTPDKTLWFNEWTQHLAAAQITPSRQEHAASLRLDPDFYDACRGLIDEFAAFGRTTLNTVLLNGRRTCENLSRNVPWYVAAGGVGRLKNAHQGKPAIVVSAGPSLRKNKHLLKDASDKSVIVAVQTTFQQLLDLGVEPDFVTSLDYHDICTQFFRNVGPNVRTELVAEPKATPKIFDLHPGPLSLLGNDYIDRLLGDAAPKRDRLPAGATVAHLAYYLAEHLGCDPIIFVGQDLGFSDGLAYTPGTSYDDLWAPELGRYNSVEMMQWQRIVRDRAILRRVPDYRGRQTYTEERLYSYLQQFERDFAATDRTIIDATEGGVAKAGARPMTLADALAEFCPSPIDKVRPQHDGLDWTALDAAEAALLRRRDEAASIQRISDDMLPLLNRLSDSLGDAEATSRLMADIDALRVEINDYATTYELVTQLGQRGELDRYAADRRIAAAAHLSGIEKQRRQLRRDTGNVAHVAKSAGNFVTLMDECVAILRDTAERKRVAA